MMAEQTGSAESENEKKEIPWAWVKRVRHLVDNPGPPAGELVLLPVQIQPWLLLSNEYNVRNPAELSLLGVTHVLTVNSMRSDKATKLRNRFMARGITHKYCPGEDEECYDMVGKHWAECRGFLESVRESGGIAVVHCGAGINRSGLIVCAAHIMVLERKPVLDVVEHCVALRSKVLWNHSFQRQLCILAAKEGLLGDKPEGYTDDPVDGEVLLPPPPPENGVYLLTM